jgi:hypothetical protein
LYNDDVSDTKLWGAQHPASPGYIITPGIDRGYIIYENAHKLTSHCELILRIDKLGKREKPDEENINIYSID